MLEEKIDLGILKDWFKNHYDNVMKIKEMKQIPVEIKPKLVLKICEQKQESKEQIYTDENGNTVKKIIL